MSEYIERRGPNYSQSDIISDFWDGQLFEDLQCAGYSIVCIEI